MVFLLKPISVAATVAILGFLSFTYYNTKRIYSCSKDRTAIESDIDAISITKNYIESEYQFTPWFKYTLSNEDYIFNHARPENGYNGWNISESNEDFYPYFDVINVEFIVQKGADGGYDEASVYISCVLIKCGKVIDCVTA
jgi:hypothetical protein